MRTVLGPLVRRALLIPFDCVRELILPSYSLYLGFFALCPPHFAMWLARWRAIRAVEEARRRVPAYRQFLRARRVASSDIRALRVPFTDKENYIKAFPTEMRCLDGKLPLADAAIDESSGSTGTPYNWVRSLKERHYSHLFISHFVRYCFGDEPWITINAFSNRIVKRLVALNADNRVAMAEQPQTASPLIQLFPRGAGPFTGDSSRIKQVRLLRP